MSRGYARTDAPAALIAEAIRDVPADDALEALKDVAAAMIAAMPDRVAQANAFGDAVKRKLAVLQACWRADAAD